MGKEQIQASERNMYKRTGLRRWVRNTVTTVPLLVTLALAGCGDNANAGGIAPTPIPYTPTETVAPTYAPPPVQETATAIPGAAATAQPSQDTHLGPNQCTAVNPGDVILGDVYINGQWATDNVADTGQITIVQAAGTACTATDQNAGADVQRWVTQEPDGGYSTVVHDAKAMQQTGCVNGCQTVLGNYWPNHQQFNPFHP